MLTMIRLGNMDFQRLYVVKYLLMGEDTNFQVDIITGLAKASHIYRKLISYFCFFPKCFAAYIKIVIPCDRHEQF